LIAAAKVLLNSPARGVSQGAALTVEIVREAIPEAGRAKHRARCDQPPPADAPDLLAASTPVAWPSAARWHTSPTRWKRPAGPKLLDEAVSGEIVFAGGALRMTPTPAMVLFDVDATRRSNHSPSLPRAPCASDPPPRYWRSIAWTSRHWPARYPRQAVPRRSTPRCLCRSSAPRVNGSGFLQIVRAAPRLAARTAPRRPGRRPARALLRTIERTRRGAQSTASPRASTRR